MSLLLGAKLPHTGPVDAQQVPRRAAELEAAGFDSLWVSDHVVMPERIESFYPFAADGRATWSPATPYLEAVTVLAAAAAVTQRVQLGTAVLVLPQRNPVLLAKQLATVSVLSGGRLELGVGAGWLREEFDALGADFDHRGRRFETWIDVLRQCWTGRPDARDDDYPLAAGTLCLPAPADPIPVLVGGHSARALERAGRLGDGWLGQQSLADLDPGALAAEIGRVSSAAVAAGRDPNAVRHILRVVGSSGRHSELAAALPRLLAAGVAEIIIDVDPSEDAAAVRAILSAGAAG